MKSYTIYQIDAFTQHQFEGNPAGVVINADGLNKTQMQQIARELNNSETAFLFSPVSSDHDNVIRYFTPTVEVPTCGHATIAAMTAKALEENLDSCWIRINTRIGILPMEIIKEEAGYSVIMTQGDVEIDPPLESDLACEIIESLGLTQEDLDDRCPVQVASTGHSKVMIGIHKKDRLNSLQPDFQRLVQISQKIHCNGYYVFTFDSVRPEILVHGRMFAPAIGIHEDPVTGNANGPLGAYLVNNGLAEMTDNTFEFRAFQGEAMGRPGIIDVKVTCMDGEPHLVQIKGRAVVVFKARLSF